MSCGCNNGCGREEGRNGGCNRPNRRGYFVSYTWFVEDEWEPWMGAREEEAEERGCGCQRRCGCGCR